MRRLMPLSCRAITATHRAEQARKEYMMTGDLLYLKAAARKPRNRQDRSGYLSIKATVLFVRLYSSLRSTGSCRRAMSSTSR